MAGSSKRVARRAVVATWRKKALELRISGLTVRAIAAKLGKAASTVHEAIEAELKAIPAEAATQLRAQRREQYEGIIQAHWAKRREPDHARVVMSALGALRELDGLDQPKATVQLSAEVASSDVRKDLLDRLARLAEAASASEDPPKPQ